MTCRAPRGKTLILKYRAWEALTAGRGLLSWLDKSALHQPKPRQWHHKQDRRTEMQTQTEGITKAGTGIEGIVWNILGQTYVPKSVSESSFSWHATFPPGTFVPPHIHPTQDEFIYLFEGRLDFLLDGKDAVAQPGDLIRLPMNVPHGIFNKSDQTVKCFFWVSPTRKLYDLFWAIHSMKEQKPEEVVALSARHEVNFLPPPA